MANNIIKMNISSGNITQKKKSTSWNVPWTPEEQQKLQELLTKYPGISTL